MSFSRKYSMSASAEEFDVLFDVFAVRNRCLRPEFPFETHIFERVRKGVTVIDGNQRHNFTFLVASTENVTGVSIRVGQANVENGDSVHFIRGKHAWTVSFSLCGIFNVFLK